MAKQTKNLLVIRFSAMGDVAMTVPVIRALIQQYPQLKITILTRANFEPFFRDIENVSVYKADLKGVHKGIFGLYRLSKELMQITSFDAIADLHNVLRTNVLRLFLKTRPFAQLDKGRKEKKQLISGSIFKQLKTTHERYADVFSAIGYPVNLSKAQFIKPITLNQKLNEIVGERCYKIIGIAPFTAHKGKMYPLDLMKVVIRELSKKHKILLFGGGKAEVEKLNELESEFINTINLAGKLTLDEELAIISNLDLMVSMDSANAHMAAMLGVKTITIWGVTHPYAGFYPFNQPSDYALISDRDKFPKIPTSVFGNKYPDDYVEASRSIPPETIIEKINSII